MAVWNEAQRKQKKKMENDYENIGGRFEDNDMMLKRSNKCLIGVLKEQERQNEAEVICEEKSNLRLSRLMKKH